jgi:hypothetical protein
MKVAVLLLVAVISLNTSLFAQKKLPTDSVEVTIRLNNYSPTPYSDSVLVIFDRYNHTGAGIIKKVYQPVNGQISIPKVPPGKYYIDIFCLGINREIFSELTYVNIRHSNAFNYTVKKTGSSAPGFAAIPVEKIDISKLQILHPRKH